MFRRRRLWVLASLAVLVLLFAGWKEVTTPVKGPHSLLELAVLRSGGPDDLVVLRSRYFTTAGRCAGCHGHDPQGVASVDAMGRDVNVADDWRSTMMANSARDPFFRAKLDHEVLVNPGHQQAIESTCLSCHAPLGMHEQRMADWPPFTAAMLDTSTIGLDGVSCLACHMQNPDSAGTLFTGQLRFDSAHVYGPYADDQIVPGVMQFFVGFTPGFGQHLVDSRNCAGCHTLITSTLDLSGNPTGDQFVEQATYHEWLNSVYPAQDKQCNTCHLPRIDDPIILAAEYIFLAPQTPFGLHHLAGGNVFMLEMLKAHRQQLGIPATEAQFDSTIARTLRMLQQSSVQLDLQVAARDADTAFIHVDLTNLTGHKFPSGYPSRRAIVQVVVTMPTGDTLFASGLMDPTYEVVGHDTPYEPHHDVITQPGQVQLYEMVMGDVNGDVTTVLERAKTPLKDNRLVPLGFSSGHPVYDTTLVAGVPASDTDFNRDAFGVEGNGGDRVRYHVALNGYTGPIHIAARVLFQPVPPGWNQEMFAYSSARIDSFRTMYENADASPTLVAEALVTDDRTGMAEQGRDNVTIWPNPSSDGVVNVSGAPMELLNVYDVSGKAVRVQVQRQVRGLRIQLPPRTPGTYLLHLRVAGRDIVERLTVTQ
ncbi:MAG: T9SS type A sorting domain-containing protein [Flavobacteriales bacterium]|nr:T9SS type A sorting domain-containing protein [Flavobacteriales bacterium]